MIVSKILENKIEPFCVGQRVLALCSDSLHTGTILACDSASELILRSHLLPYQDERCPCSYIQFDKADLGVQQVKDVDMIAYNEEEPIGAESISLNEVRDRSLNPHMRALGGEGVDWTRAEMIDLNLTEIDDKNVKAMGMLHLLLQRKEFILKELERMNKLGKADQDDIKQKYAWVSLQLLVTNEVIDPVLAHFRLRKLKESNSPDKDEDMLNEDDEMENEAEEQQNDG